MVPKNLISGPFWELLVPKTPKQQFSKYVSPNFQSLCCCNFMQKSQENSKHRFIMKIKAHFGALFVQKPQSKIFPKKSLKSILCLYAAVTLCKKSEKFHASIFSQNLKNLILGPSWTLFCSTTIN